MGVRGLLSYLERNGFTAPINLAEVAQKHFSSTKVPIDIVVDMSALMFSLFEKSFEAIDDFYPVSIRILKFLETCNKNNIILHFFFDSIPAKSKVNTKMERNERLLSDYYDVINSDYGTRAYVSTDRELRPTSIGAHTFFLLNDFSKKHKTVFLHACASEADEAAAAFCVENKCYGVISNDSDFVIYGCRTLLSKTLDFSQEGIIRCTMIDPEVIEKKTGLARSLFPVVACIVGNDVSRTACPFLETYVKGLLRKQFAKTPVPIVFNIVSVFAQKNPSLVKNEKEFAEQFCRQQIRTTNYSSVASFVNVVSQYKVETHSLVSGYDLPFDFERRFFCINNSFSILKSLIAGAENLDLYLEMWSKDDFSFTVPPNLPDKRIFPIFSDLRIKLYSLTAKIANLLHDNTTVLIYGSNGRNIFSQKLTVPQPNEDHLKLLASEEISDRYKVLCEATHSNFPFEKFSTQKWEFCVYSTFAYIFHTQEPFLFEWEFFALLKHLFEQKALFESGKSAERISSGFTRKRIKPNTRALFVSYLLQAKTFLAQFFHMCRLLPVVPIENGEGFFIEMPPPISYIDSPQWQIDFLEAQELFVKEKKNVTVPNEVQEFIDTLLKSCPENPFFGGTKTEEKESNAE